MSEPPPPRCPILTPLTLLAAMVFAVAHTQPPLYYSNQNQYFLHGLADAGYGDLRADWLANTKDPTPVFSEGVRWGYMVFGDWTFHAAFFALLVAYFLSLWGIVTALPVSPRTRGGQMLLATALIVVHAGIVRAGSVAAFGVDYPWYFQAGIANQYLLGAGLQPSVFGVLLLSSLAAYVRGRPVLAGALAAGACVFHSTYLLHAGLLVFAMMVAEALAGRRRTAVTIGAVALAVVAPVVAHVYLVFGGSGPKQFGAAQDVLAWVRIPHHTDAKQWMDWVAGLQIAWAALGLVLLRRTPLFRVLTIATALALALTLVQLATDSATLALLFPWRISAVLVPLATAVLLAAGVQRVEAWVSPSIARTVTIAAGLASIAGAMLVYEFGLAYQSSAAEETLLAYVRNTHQPGERYLLPTGFPPPAKARGSASSSFVPVTAGGPKIFELQRFRLSTGAAAYVDFKSIPYQDVEVVEWHDRVGKVEKWYKESDWDAAGIVDELREERITHVVVPAGTTIRSSRLERVFNEKGYEVYRITG